MIEVLANYGAPPHGPGVTETASTGSPEGLVLTWGMVLVALVVVGVVALAVARRRG